MKKLDATGAAPKLSWFPELHKAFGTGKIKSFRKSGIKKEPKSHKSSMKLIEVDYQDMEGDESYAYETDEKEDVLYKYKTVQDNSDSERHHVIIEPYEEEYEEEYITEMEPPESMQKMSESSRDLNESSSSKQKGFPYTGLQSNELFLKSLQSTLDRLPEEKNMRARIKIQEVLYSIAYEVDK